MEHRMCEEDRGAEEGCGEDARQGHGSLDVTLCHNLGDTARRNQ
jgi:hypothetical protein